MPTLKAKKIDCSCSSYKLFLDVAMTLLIVPQVRMTIEDWAIIFSSFSLAQSWHNVGKEWEIFFKKWHGRRCTFFGGTSFSL